MKAEDLIAFEDRMAALFEAGRIKAPLHLAGGNETQLIEYFDEHVRREDWVLCGWRSHYHCLLKHVPPEDVEAAIIEGRSIALCFPRYRVLCSAIVGGIAPIAMGIAWAIKRRGGSERVHCFVGDMTAETGIYHESEKYAYGHDLPVAWLVEDNRLSVCTKTETTWGAWAPEIETTYYYKYDMTRPHVGIGKWVSF